MAQGEFYYSAPMSDVSKKMKGLVKENRQTTAKLIETFSDCKCNSMHVVNVELETSSVANVALQDEVSRVRIGSYVILPSSQALIKKAKFVVFDLRSIVPSSSDSIKASVGCSYEMGFARGLKKPYIVLRTYDQNYTNSTEYFFMKNAPVVTTDDLVSR